MSQGDDRAAKEKYRRTLTTMEITPGLEHLDTLDVVSNLAAVLHIQGKYEESIKIKQWAMRDREKILGPELPITQGSLNIEVKSRRPRRCIGGY